MPFALRLLTVLLLVVGGSQFAIGLWIPAKAALAQALLEAAWQRTTEMGERVRPWPWADTWPVARLTVPRLNTSWIVLSGSSGRTLAFGPGSFIHIGKPEEVAEKMAGLFRKLESVLLRDIDLEVFGVQVLEQYPARIPDLYVGESISVALKLDKPLGAIALSGQSGDAIWNLEYASDDVRERTGVHVQWARRKIDALMDARLGVHDEGTLAQLRDETVTVAQDHHLVSAYTSLVAVDVTPQRYSSERLNSHALATNLPAGWSFGSVFGMASTATSAHLHLAMGFLLIGLGWLIRKPWALH